MVLLDLVTILFYLFYAAIIIEVLLSWVPGARETPAGYAVHRLTRPILDPIRRLVPPVGGFDLSPFVAILLLTVLRRILTDLVIGLLF
ncbi:MAG: YggT family protein [Armatimonadetes bacterium]|nr:YggT family protein [Armatimonadota bacterium]